MRTFASANNKKEQNDDDNQQLVVAWFEISLVAKHEAVVYCQKNKKEARRLRRASFLFETINNYK